jgi:hypothetical protein
VRGRYIGGLGGFELNISRWRRAGSLIGALWYFDVLLAFGGGPTKNAREGGHDWNEESEISLHGGEFSFELFSRSNAS